MFWVMVFLGLAVAGIAVLALCAVRVFVAVRTLGHQIERVRADLEPKNAALGEQVRRLERTRE